MGIVKKEYAIEYTEQFLEDVITVVLLTAYGHYDDK
jgi:hypothetical protein